MGARRRPSEGGQPAALAALRRVLSGLALPVAAVLALIAAQPTVAEAQACLATNTCLHGIGFAKGCLGPTPIGDPYSC
jgi:hypothetical protein